MKFIFISLEPEDSAVNKDIEENIKIPNSIENTENQIEKNSSPEMNSDVLVDISTEIPAVSHIAVENIGTIFDLFFDKIIKQYNYNLNKNTNFLCS